MFSSAANKKLARLAADCCELTYEQYKQNGVYEVPEGFRHVSSFQAQAIGTTEWFGFIIESEDWIAVAFRGTQSDAEWIADSLIHQSSYPYTAGSCLVHSGFLSIYETCRDTIMETLAALSKEKKLLITGHSLGGALAVLHALDARVNTAFADLVMYSFGAPKTGDIAFRNYYNLQVSKSFRLVNLFDVVPLLPPHKVKFEKAAQDWEYFHVNNSITFAMNLSSITKNHHISTYQAAIDKWS